MEGEKGFRVKHNTQTLNLYRHMSHRRFPEIDCAFDPKLTEHAFFSMFFQERFGMEVDLNTDMYQVGYTRKHF